MRATLIKLGLFVTLCVVITVALVFSIGNVQSLRVGPVQLLDDSYKLHATFDDVTGLLINDNVKVAGVVVGKVTGIQVREGKADVTFRVKDAMKLPVDTEAAIRWRNLLGQRYLYLYPGEASTTLESGARVTKTISVVDLGELLNRLGPIVASIEPAKVNDFLDTIVGALSGNEAKIGAAIDNLAAVAKVLGDRDEAVGRLVGNIDTVAAAVADRDREIRQVLDNLNTITKTFSENTTVLDAAVVELADYNGHLSAILGNNRAAIDGIVSNLAIVVAALSEKLPVLDHAVGGLDDAAKRLANVSRYGEWLDQSILCIRIQAAVTLDAPCPELPNENAASLAGPRRSKTSGVGAVRELLSLGGLGR